VKRFLKLFTSDFVFFKCSIECSISAATLWLQQALQGTKAYIAAQAMNDGREDAMEALDGRYSTKEQKEASVCQSPVHFNCCCIWVGMREE
jgi:hypothetical protein